MRPFLTPKWILSHVFVATMVIVMTGLGFWQLNRLDERKDLNEVVRAAIEADPVPIEEMLDTNSPDHRAVLVRGTYDPTGSVLIANRTYETQAGYWLVTPMRLVDGRSMMVSRGWVPRTWVAGNDTREIATPTGEIEVLGRIHASVGGGRVGSTTDAGLVEMTRLDLPQVEEFLGLALEDSWVQLVEQAPPLAELPVPVPPPGLDEGPHLSYAFQWFFFSTATVIAYALILRKRSREVAVEAVE
ncbi:MAG: SURF1 family protein [Acidimicrobiales bacterium]|jgi:surfeit locus 1 family protein|nr:SURF1 family protein [Acidimicrobiales bacterium]